MELNLDKVTKGNKKSWYSYSIDKRQIREKSWALSEKKKKKGNHKRLFTWDMEKVEAFLDILAQIFNSKQPSHTAQVGEDKSRHWEEKELPATEN